MYYATTQDLPRTLQETLPVDAQTRYLETYNRVWEEQAELGVDDPTLSTIAHQMAWDAMTGDFTLVKDAEGSKWYRKGEEAKMNGHADQAQKKSFWQRLGFG